MKRKFLIKIIKFLILLLSFGIVFHKIKGFFHESEGILFIDHSKIIIAGFIFIILLMVINWLVEALKWKILTKDIQFISIKYSLISVLVGITFGLLTPKRLGEVGGRSIMLDEGNRLKGMMSFGLGSITQTCVTVFFGAIALVLAVIGNYTEALPKSEILLLATLIVLILSIAIIFNLPRIIKWLTKQSFIKDKKELFNTLENQSRKSVAIIMLLGAGRYVIFSFQFFLLVRLFGNTLETTQVFTGIGIMYLIITFLPLSSLLELGVRGSVVAFVFGLFTTQTGDIVLASLAIWIVNLGIPALIGGLLLWQTKYIEPNTSSIKKKIQLTLRKV